MSLKLVSAFLFSGFLSAAHVPRPIPGCADYVGERPLSTVAWELHGQDPLHPSPESLLGRYLRETGAVSWSHRFEIPKAGQGPEKLVVAVGPRSFARFAELFGNTYPNVLEHLHTPRQGTLIIRWMTEIFQYASPRGDWKFPGVGSIGPLILLSDSETRRLKDYFDLNRSGSAYCRRPSVIDGYGYPKDAYIQNCTAWVGHIPVGDDAYTRIVVPGSVDLYGDRGASEPRWGTLTPYQVPELQGVDPILFARVWSAPLHIRLWDLLGVPFESANHTNPGWVAVSITAMTSSERNPFVVAYVADHTKKPHVFDPQIRAVGP